MLRIVNLEGGGGGGGESFFFSDCPLRPFWFLPWLIFCSNGPLATGLLFWAVIIIVCDAARMLSSSVENLSAQRYSSSIVTGGSKDRDWKKGVISPKLLLKFCKTASILYTSICWTACPNLRVKSRMDSSSRLRIDWRELMFPFCLIEHKYWETKAAHRSPNVFTNPLGSLLNQAKVGPLRLAGNTLQSSRSSLALRIIA